MPTQPTSSSRRHRKVMHNSKAKAKKRSERSSDLAARARAEELYVPTDKTMEVAETHYYKVRHATAKLCPINEFWADLASHRSQGKTLGSFASPFFPIAGSNLTEALLAIAVCAVAESPSPVDFSPVDQTQATLSCATPFLLYDKALATVEAPSQTTVLVGQNYLDPQEMFVGVGNNTRQNFLTSFEFLPNKPYMCQIVVTNVSSNTKPVEVLYQIPQGSLPLRNRNYEHVEPVTLQPYESKTIVYTFYFPRVGHFTHYPVHVAHREELVAHCPPTSLDVVVHPTTENVTSWTYVATRGTREQVLTFLRTANLEPVRLDMINWRMTDAGFCEEGVWVCGCKYVCVFVRLCVSACVDSPIVVRSLDTCRSACHSSKPVPH